ncbi:hypothetical protein J6590_084808 [Homalodisca vitripennis]|nr:hypothetical protein J6590_084808 [Homalodisca vitripennis]
MKLLSTLTGKLTGTMSHERDSPKVNVFCAISANKDFGPYIFEGGTATGLQYLEMLENWLFPQLEQEAQQFIFQQDGVPPHWHFSLRDYLNVKYPSDGSAARHPATEHFITDLQETMILPPEIFL